MICPSCGAIAGFPFKATTSLHNSGLEIAVRCHACHDEWRAFLDRVDPDQTSPNQTPLR